MQPSDTWTKLKVIHSHIEQRHLKQAIEGVRTLASLSQLWAITEKISELETNYQYMLHYLIEGKKDPEQQHIYEKLIRDLYAVADDAAEHLLLQESSSLFLKNQGSYRYVFLFRWMNTGTLSRALLTPFLLSASLKRARRKNAA